MLERHGEPIVARIRCYAARIDYFCDMEILEINSLDAAPFIPLDVMVADLLGLMKELDPTLSVTPAMLQAAVEDPNIHLFVAVEDGHVIGTASLCVMHCPSETKARIEDGAVASSYRGRGIGRRLMEHMLEFARRELAPVELNLTSRPARVAANQLYRSLGFLPYETNVYKMKL